MPDLPDDVTHFLARHISSVMQLEVLLALRAEARPVTTRQLIRGIGGSVDQVLHAILALEQSGLVEQLDDETDIGARYVAEGKLDATVANVAQEYAKRKVRVVTFLLRDPSDPLESFSDAFKLRRDR